MSSIPNFLERLESVDEPRAFEKVCEDIVAGKLTGSYNEFLVLFDRLVNTRIRVLGPEGVFNAKATNAISHTVRERARVAPPNVDKAGRARVRIFWSRRRA